MPEKHVTVTLSEEAFQLARNSKDVALPAGTVAKILATPIDISQGNDRLCRHPTLTVTEAQKLHEYYRRFADAYTKVGDGPKALICATARAAIRHELWKAGLSK